MFMWSWWVLHWTLQIKLSGCFWWNTLQCKSDFSYPWQTVTHTKFATQKVCPNYPAFVGQRGDGQRIKKEKPKRLQANSERPIWVRHTVTLFLKGRKETIKSSILRKLLTVLQIDLRWSEKGSRSIHVWKTNLGHDII